MKLLEIGGQLQRLIYRGVAQSGSAPASGVGGRRFKSSRPDQFIMIGSGFAADHSSLILIMVQAHIFVHGRVQGVGFRYNVRRRAAALALKGYVRNLVDGRVEILARGSRERLGKFIGFMKNNPGISYVVKLDIDWEEPLGELEDFRIKF